MEASLPDLSGALVTIGKAVAAAVNYSRDRIGRITGARSLVASVVVLLRYASGRG